MKYTYPACKTVDVTETWFETRLPDPYAWLKNAKDPEVLDFVARENAFTDTFFDGPALDAKITALKAAERPELPGSIVPWKDGYLCYIYREGRAEIWQLDSALRKTGKFPEISGAEGMDLFMADPCPGNGRYGAIMAQYPGDARPTILVCDLEKLEVIHEISMSFSCCWSKRDNCLYYSTTESDSEAQTCRSAFLRYDPVTRQEQVVYEDDSYAVFGQVHASTDGAWIMAQVCRDYSCARYVALDASGGGAHVLTEEPREWSYMDTVDGVHYFISLTNAEYGEVLAVDRDGHAEVKMRGSRSRILESGFSAGGRLFVIAKEDVCLRLIDLAAMETVPLPSAYPALTLAGKYNGGVFLKYESFLDAPRLERFDGRTLKTVCATDEREYPDLTVEQKFTPSTDGTQVPYFIVRRKDASMDGNRPVVMYAYGGYNIGMAPWSQEMVTGLDIRQWAQSGGIYVHLNIRGGNEYGPKWHEDGMGLTKRHCYEDFISVAERLISEGWTSPQRIGITGCSNGGLLMSALVTMRPDLWGCVIDSVPHTDMIHFAEDDRGPMYITEYGNPWESREMFEYLLSYSPYHNVRKTCYPPTYIQTGEMDNNVPPYHGKKLAARMQAENQSENPVLLRVLAEGSHDRGKGEAYWRTTAEMQLFLETYLKEG